MRKIIAALPILGLLAGCTSTGMLTPAAQANVTNAYNIVCPSVAALGGLQMNANQAKAYAAAEEICANGAPTNVVVAGLDIIAVQAALAPLIAKVKIKA